MNESTPQKNCIGNDKEQIGNISNNTCTLGYREDNPNLDDMAINKAGKLSKKLLNDFLVLQENQFKAYDPSKKTMIKEMV